MTIVKPCDSAFVPVPSAAPRRGARGTACGTLRSRVATDSIGEHGRVCHRYRCRPRQHHEHTLRPISGRGELDPFLLAGGFRHAQKCCWTVHAFLAETYGRSLTSMLVELAMMHLYGLPKRHTTIVKRCDMKLDAVLRYLMLQTCRGPPSDEQSSRTRARVTGRHRWPTCVRL